MPTTFGSLNIGGDMGRPRTGREYNCKSCGVAFYRNRADIARGRVHYCSNACVNRLGENNPCWRGGSFINERGYRRIRVDGKYPYEHRYLMQKHLNRKLLRNEHVHHINGDKLDNRIENLTVLDWHEHSRLHAAIG